MHISVCVWGGDAYICVNVSLATIVLSASYVIVALPIQDIYSTGDVNGASPVGLILTVHDSSQSFTFV